MAERSLLMAAKRLVNLLIAPIWCDKCGSRLLEAPIGYREQGSRYRCLNPSCAMGGLTILALN